MLLLGLTGSIASGKSTVSRLLSSPPYNLPIIDADVLAREVVLPGTSGFRQIVAHFSGTTPDLLLADGTLDRSVLGRRVFGDDEAHRKDRAVLNGIVHPLVRRKMWRRILSAYARGCWAVVLDVPLLFEAGMHRFCGGCLVVSVDEETQMARLMEREKGRGMTFEEARRRVGSQMSAREKEVLLEAYFGDRGWVARNDGGFEELEKEVAKVMMEVRKGREGWWKWVLWGCPPLAVLVGLWTIVVNRKRRKQWERRTAKL